MAFLRIWLFPQVRLELMPQMFLLAVISNIIRITLTLKNRSDCTNTHTNVVRTPIAYAYLWKAQRNYERRRKAWAFSTLYLSKYRDTTQAVRSFIDCTGVVYEPHFRATSWAVSPPGTTLHRTADWAKCISQAFALSETGNAALMGLSPCSFWGTWRNDCLLLFSLPLASPLHCHKSTESSGFSSSVVTLPHCMNHTIRVLRFLDHKQ